MKKKIIKNVMCSKTHRINNYVSQLICKCFIQLQTEHNVKVKLQIMDFYGDRLIQLMNPLGHLPKKEPL